MIDRLEINILGGNDGPVEDVESIGHEVVGCFSRRNCGVGRIGDSGSKTLYRCDIDRVNVVAHKTEVAHHHVVPVDCGVVGVGCSSIFGLSGAVEITLAVPSEVLDGDVEVGACLVVVVGVTYILHDNLVDIGKVGGGNRNIAVA